MKPPAPSGGHHPAYIPLFLLLVALAPPRLTAQGDGPRVYPLAPVGINVASGTYMNLSSNYNFQQSIQIDGADITSNVAVLAYLRMFRVGRRFAQLWVAPVWGTVGGTIEANPAAGYPTAISAPTISGFADPYVQARVGLVGAPALTMAEFVKHTPGFQLYAMSAVFIPVGDYSSRRPVNLGTNRWAFRVGAPMELPLGPPARPVQLELIPSVYFYTDNTDPYGSVGVRSQDPLFVAEGHASRNLTSAFWVGVDLRYQAGGETFSDGATGDNRTNHLGGGLTAGYQLTRPLMVFVSYGGILAESDGSRGTMIRVRANLTF